ncbi:MAG TPA: hypothetical protein VFW05_19445 [Verrucomicrobiae bacterium]|nr:hypothetical protein [Verrucomicrobiae bacterium]
MTLESFFGKFELFADVPDAVAKMRELARRHATRWVALSGLRLFFDRHTQGVALGWREPRRWRSRSVPKGASQRSPGQRPGFTISHSSQALKGRPTYDAGNLFRKI